MLEKTKTTEGEPTLVLLAFLSNSNLAGHEKGIALTAYFEVITVFTQVYFICRLIKIFDDVSIFKPTHERNEEYNQHR